MLEESFCIANETPRLAEKFSIKFNKPLPPILNTAGLSGQEWFGRWSDGHKVVLEVPVDMTWKGLLLKIKGEPYTPQGITSQQMSFSVHGSKVKELSVASESEIVIHSRVTETPVVELDCKRGIFCIDRNEINTL